MRSTWRAVSDPTVDFDYNVTPHLVGHLGDLVFDGQTAITQRGLRGREKCTYVGNSRFLPDPPEGDAASLEPYAGRKREFLALAPWVVPDNPRSALRAVAGQARPRIRRPARERLPRDGDRGRPAVPARLVAAQLHLLAAPRLARPAPLAP